MPEQAAKFPWNMQAIGLPDLWEKLGNRGSGIKIGVIDSGIYSGHPEFDGAHIEGGGFVTTPEDFQDRNGHGTACAGLLVAQGKQVYGVCPDATLSVARIYDTNNQIKLSKITEAIHWLVHTKNVQLVSVSLSCVYMNPTQYKADIDALQAEISAAYENGILVLSTIGNNDNNFNIPYSYPAASQHCISVGAYNGQGKIYNLTPVYSKLDLLAPGENVSCLGYKPDTLYTTFSGTSYAVPVAAGVVALLMKAMNTHAVQAYEYLKNNIQETITSPKNNLSFPKLSTQINLPFV